MFLTSAGDSELLLRKSAASFTLCGKLVSNKDLKISNASLLTTDS